MNHICIESVAQLFDSLHDEDVRSLIVATHVVDLPDLPVARHQMIAAAFLFRIQLQEW